MFHLGQRVVCLQDDWRIPKGQQSMVPNLPKKNHVYTIRGFEPGVEDPKETFIFLEEVVNPEKIWGKFIYKEASFNIVYFRPLEEKKTDISVFQKMLNPAPSKKKEKENA